MKPFRVFVSLIIAVAVLFASALSVNAIGFEAEEAYESVFVIYSGNSMGSGFAVGGNCIVTNAHVIGDIQRITVETYGGAKYSASVIGMNEPEDIAVLAVENSGFPFLNIGDLSSMKTGDDIYAIGAPKGMAYTLTKGSISAKERLVRNQSYIQIDAPINEGNSGGPLLNDSGSVIGMNTLKISDSEGIGFAIPISRVCDYLRSLGIKLNANGNVAENIEISEGTKPDYNMPDTGDENKSENENENKPENKENEWKIHFIACLAVVIAALSIAGNVVLAVLYINEKKKYVALQYDPSERTDFEIDILE